MNKEYNLDYLVQDEIETAQAMALKLQNIGNKRKTASRERQKPIWWRNPLFKCLFSLCGFCIAWIVILLAL